MRKVVGISQKIKRAWLDAVLDQLVKTPEEAELRTVLDKRLEEELPGAESRAKASGIMLQIWSRLPPERISLRNRAVTMLSQISGHERIWLHWGMAALAYPFFRDTAEVVGRLLALQDDFTTAQVQGRMLTTWGDRDTSKEAVQKLITSLVDWDVLRSTKTKGRFLLAQKMTASIPDLQLWLLEALLRASDADEIEARQLLRLPESFPFAISVGVADLRRHEGFNIHRQGFDMDMVTLSKVKLESPTKKLKKEKTSKPAQASLFETDVEDVGSNGAKPDTAPMVAVTIPPAHGAVCVPDSPFAASSAECVEQFRDGHYFGCIALTQAVLEAAIHQVWQIKLKKKPNQESSFERNLEALHKKKIINIAWKTKLDKMWTERHSFHYWHPSIEPDQKKLQEKARSNLTLLRELEQTFFPSNQ